MKHTLYIMYSAAHTATRSACTATRSACAATLLTLLLVMAGACSREDAQVIAPDGFPADGRLAIGQLTIANESPNAPAARSRQSATDSPNTRVALGAESWETGDGIRLTATGKNGTTLLAYYIYKENATWEQEDFASIAGEPADTYPLYIDDIDRNQPIRIDSWGGRPADAEQTDALVYTQQGVAPDGSINYHRNNHLACPAATLHTAADAAAGITRGSLSATLTHQRVDVVVRILTDAAHPLSDKTADTRLHLTLPATNSTGTDGATVWSWMQGSTPATSTQKAYTTFRAYLKLSDVPGAGAVQTDATGNSYVVVTDASPLATLSYATTVDGTALPGSGKLNLRYSVQPTAGQPTRVQPGTRLVVTVDFTTLQNPVLTATVEPWQTVDEGDVGTLPGTAKADGAQPLDPAAFNAEHPTWIVTGGGTPEADATVLKNVRDALDRIYAPLDAANNQNPAYTGTARIDLQLPEMTTLPFHIITIYGCGAFQAYGQLRSISLPQATTIEMQAFIGCKALTTVTLPVAESIGESAFNNCAALTTVSLPAAKSIGNAAFQGCAALATISLPEATSIERNAFQGCKTLTTISLPAATGIGNEAFYNCAALATISLPEATSIGNYAFFDCAALTTATLPQATSIGLAAFYGCAALTDVSLPQATTIETQAFIGCKALTTISLPAATSIGDLAFANCAALIRLELTAAGNFELHASAFDGFNAPACTLLLNPDKKADATGTASPKVTADGNGVWRNWGTSFGSPLTWLAIDYLAAPAP